MSREYSCEFCLNTWNVPQFVHKHVCIASKNPTTHDLLNLLKYETDERGCLIPTNAAAITYAGYKGKYVQLRSSVIRGLGMKESYVHRAIWRLEHDKIDIPEGLHVSHECADEYENSRCCNPAHLQLRTPKENHAHMSASTRRRISEAGGRKIKNMYAEGLRPCHPESGKSPSEALKAYYATHSRTSAQIRQFETVRNRAVLE